jgi:hypothetical protein
VEMLKRVRLHGIREPVIRYLSWYFVEYTFASLSLLSISCTSWQLYGERRRCSGVIVVAKIGVNCGYQFLGHVN